MICAYSVKNLKCLGKLTSYPFLLFLSFYFCFFKSYCLVLLIISLTSSVIKFASFSSRVNLSATFSFLRNQYKCLRSLFLWYYFFLLLLLTNTILSLNLSRKILFQYPSYCFLSYAVCL